MATELDSRFFADNLLSSEDWDACLYNYETMEEMDDSVDLFHCFDSATEFDLNMEIGLPYSPWNPVNDDSCTDLQVKLEPLSPASSRCSDSSLSSSCDIPLIPQIHQNLNTETTLPVVKTEDPPTPPCTFGDVLNPPVNGIELNVVKTENGTSPVKQGPAIQTTTSIKANSILCSKPTIQPKPVVVTRLPTAPSTSPAKTIILQSVQTSLPVSKPQSLPVKQTIPVSRQSVVLSQSDLVRIPVQGLIKVPAANGTINGIAANCKRPTGVGNGITINKPATKPIVPAPTHTGSNSSEIDIKLLKRQQRMIKNRESACQSRKKKKEYLQGLESKLREALSENEKLKRENSLLKKKLDSIVSENTELKLGSGNRKAACVMAFLLFIAFTFGPASITEKKTDLFQKQQEDAYVQRHLLAFKEEQATESATQQAARDYKQQDKFSNITMAYSEVKDLVLRDIDRILFPSSDCRQFNKTESLRLADELRGWVHRHQIDRTKSNEKPKRQKKFKQGMRSQQRKINLPRFIPVQSADTDTRLTSSQLQVYQSPEQSYYDFMDAIDRREDTFYVVSFRRDHLLLPAISHNKTNRPKMSLVMPAMPVNESLYNTTQGYEVMMQIDCEVMDTRIIQIKSSSVPPSLRQPQDNRTSSFHSHSGASRSPSPGGLQPRPQTVTAPSSKDSLYLSAEVAMWSLG
ncbi:cyclic AMP-dependent transcription factor ATF-6 beta isoform X2 [Pristis pectinata]|uniref:cyclic AMP-dependent transcription factor ATF-6 beta isoform X2 n=1 Tax=Pristis pectinata TaxID=685728 RepID=UPI00223D230D|nr:cyclic AMP-dependent transcription factor ATF-6 beta isoform X2 [Pristis pectinata]